MEILIRILQLLLSLSILVVLHELGHFLFARLFKTRVEKFYLFFDPWFSLFKLKKGDTEYGIGWIPLGGYVKISGMIDESMDKEQLKQPAQPWEFRSKSTWQRLLIMLGGVLVNFVLALLIYVFILFTWGEDYLPAGNAKYGIAADSAAVAIGLQSGDRIVSVDGRVIEDFHRITADIVLNQAKSIQIVRDTVPMEIAIPENLISRLIKDQRFIDVRIPFVIAEFSKESAGKEAGLQKGDSIVGLNGEYVPYFDAFKSKLQSYKGQEISVQIYRSGQPAEVKVIVPESGLLGIAPVGNLQRFFETRHIQYGFFEAFPAGIQKGLNTSMDYLKQIPLIFSSKHKGYESLGSFITIGSLFPPVWDWQIFWTMTAFLSIILAIMNILPIPALDGGHVLFLLYEIITGRKPSDKFLEYAQIVGMVLVLGLLVFALRNDIVRFFF